MDPLGIDIAKASFDATLLGPNGAGQHRVFANAPDGFSELAAWLNEQHAAEASACMEATNIYWEALASFLHARNPTVSVVTPARIKGCAQATMQRNKTDKLDRAIIAEFCLKHQPSAWQPMSEAQQQLRALLRHRADLLQTKLQQHNRLRNTTNALVRRSWEQVRTAIATQLSEVEQAIKEQVAAEATIKANVALLTTIVGIGALTASRLVAECGELGEYERAKAAAAAAGLSPAKYERGSTVRRRTRVSKQGKAGVRQALYMPALVVLRRCPAFKAFGERLAAWGKPKKVIIVAVMRKLMHIAYGVLKHQTSYDPSKVCGQLAPSRYYLLGIYFAQKEGVLRMIADVTWVEGQIELEVFPHWVRVHKRITSPASWAGKTCGRG